jgi:tRNA-dihydrouridine synthase
MIGRGALRNPFLFSEIKSSEVNLPNIDPLKLISRFYEACLAFKSENLAISRSKQWLNQLSQNSEEAKALFEQLKSITKPVEFKKLLDERTQYRKIYGKSSDGKKKSLSLL